MASGDAPAADAAGCPHTPRTTWLSEFAVPASTKTTLASWPIAEHSPDTAASDPPYVAEVPVPGNRTLLTNLARPEELCPTEGRAARPGFSDVPAPGIAIASTQQDAAAMAVHRDAPSLTARAVSREEAQSPSRISPGSTTSTSRWLAQGWSGSSAGAHSTVTTDQPMIRIGSPHRRANVSASLSAPPAEPRIRLGSPPSRATGSASLSAPSPAAARAHRHPSAEAPATASSTAGIPRYQNTQSRL